MLPIISEFHEVAAIAIAIALKLKVVAEGVETQEQLKVLENLGCNIIQGYLFSKPVESKNMSELLKSDKCLKDVLQNYNSECDNVIQL